MQVLISQLMETQFISSLKMKTKLNMTRLFSHSTGYLNHIFVTSDTSDESKQRANITPDHSHLEPQC